MWQAYVRGQNRRDRAVRVRIGGPSFTTGSGAAVHPGHNAHVVLFEALRIAVSGIDDDIDVDAGWRFRGTGTGPIVNFN